MRRSSWNEWWRSEEVVHSLPVNLSLSQRIGDVIVKEQDHVDVVFVFSERVGCNAAYLQPDVIEEIGHCVEEREVSADDSGVDAFLAELVADDGDETEAVDGDGHRLNQRHGDVVGGEVDDFAAVLLQRENGIDVPFVVAAVAEVVSAVHFSEEYDEPIGNDQR